MDPEPSFVAARWADGPIGYPDPAVHVIDPRFDRCRIENAAVERIAGGFRWAEGPVWFGDHRCLLWSDVPNDRMMRWDDQTGAVSTFRAPANNTNGHTRDREGRLVSCEHLSRRVTRTEPDGSITVLLDAWEARRLNSPNDVVVKSDGSVWFSDPSYGIISDYEGRRAPSELPTRVYRIDPSGAADVVLEAGFEQPNGLCFSPDESLLYVVDSGVDPGTIQVCDVAADGALGDPRVWVGMGQGCISDGIRCDTDGNVWSAAAGGGLGYDGVHVFAPDATLIGQILLPERCANLCFGGPKQNRLFMTASQSVYALYVDVTGAAYRA